MRSAVQRYNLRDALDADCQGAPREIAELGGGVRIKARKEYFK